MTRWKPEDKTETQKQKRNVVPQAERVTDDMADIEHSDPVLLSSYILGVWASH